MSLQFIRSRTALAMIGGAVLAGAFITNYAKADEWDKKTTLTVSEPIQIRDTYLEPGQYVLKLLNSSSDRHIVQIFNSDQSHLINTIIAIPKERLEPTGRSEFTFWETPAGKARAMRAWFYPGDLIGNEFPYPKHLREVAMVETAAAAAAPAPPPPAVTVAPTPMEQPKTEEPVEMPQTTPPAVEPAQTTPPAATTPAPTTPPAENNEANRSAELPKTASPYPLIGLAGLLLIGLSGVLRLTRSA